MGEIVGREGGGKGGNEGGKGCIWFFYNYKNFFQRWFEIYEFSIFPKKEASKSSFKQYLLKDYKSVELFADQINKQEEKCRFAYVTYINCVLDDPDKERMRTILNVNNYLIIY